MGSGFQVNHAELTDAGSKTAGKADEAEGIKSKVAAANGQVPTQAWGLLGQLGPHEIYESFFSSFSSHVDDMISGLQTFATNIKSTADQYKQNEADVQEKLGDVMKDLDGTAKPPETSGGGAAEGA